MQLTQPESILCPSPQLLDVRTHSKQGLGDTGGQRISTPSSQASTPRRSSPTLPCRILPHPFTVPRPYYSRQPLHPCISSYSYPPPSPHLHTPPPLPIPASFPLSPLPPSPTPKSIHQRFGMARPDSYSQTVFFKSDPLWCIVKTQAPALYTKLSKNPTLVYSAKIPTGAPL